MAVLYNAPWAVWFVAGMAFCILAAYGVHTVLYGRVSEKRVVQAGGSVVLGRWLVEAYYWSFHLPERLFIALNVSPDALTWASLLVTLGAAPAAATGHFATAGAFVLIGAFFDAFDGMVARARGVGSDCGEFLDAFVDRYSDAIPLIGLTIFYRFSVWQMMVPIMTMIGSVALSYVRAKAEALRIELPRGLMRRHERVTYVVIALVLGPELSPWIPHPFDAVHPATLALLAVVAIISNFMAFDQMAFGRKELVRVGRGPNGAAR